MRRKELVSGLLVLVGLLSLSLPAAADTAPLPNAAAGLQRVTSTTVRMAAEKIEIQVQRVAEPGHLSMQTVAKVAVHFHFIPGADETLQAGFPINASDRDRRLQVHPTQFAVLADGKPLSYEERTVDYAGGATPWAVWTLALQKDQPLDLDVRYQMPVEHYGKSWSSDLDLFYLLQTGRFWSGPIGHAEAVVHFDRPLQAADVRQETTPGWTLTKTGDLAWTWTDLLPDFDLQVRLANAYWLDLPAEATELAHKPALTRRSSCGWSTRCIACGRARDGTAPGSGCGAASSPARRPMRSGRWSRRP